MALVDYGSSDSEEERPKPSAPSTNRKGTSSKQTFEKFVDKSNPGKIRLNIAPESSKSPQEDPSDGPEPAAKRVKTGGFGGFNSLLPAPKRVAGTAPGLRKGVNLKTGAEPAFSRDPMPETQSYDAGPSESNGVKSHESTVRPTNFTDEKGPAQSETLSDAKKEGPTKKATIFKPLSVARKPQKKRSAPIEGRDLGASTNEAKTTRSDLPPKLSLFSAGDTSESTSIPSKPSGTYQPLIYQPNDDHLGASDLTPQSMVENPSAFQTEVPSTTSISSKQGDSLDDIAADLNLSASARRQLLGRNQRDGRTAPIKITNFNTDEEYAANELLRQSGEIVQHNAVRGIAPGKHSLKQLVNAATNQKDALEEQFAAGRRNKHEAGAKYGW